MVNLDDDDDEELVVEKQGGGDGGTSKDVEQVCSVLAKSHLGADHHF